MHIVYLIEHIDKIGGIERSLTLRVNYLINVYKHKITIVCTEKDTGIPAFEIDDSVNFVFLDKLTSKKSFIGRIYLRYQQSRNILKVLNPDIVISTKYTLHNVFFRFFFTKSKFISEIREPKQLYNENRSKSIKSILNCTIRDYVFKKQDVMIVLTKADKINWGFNNIQVVPNPHTIQPDKVSKLLNTQVLALGRLHPVKGFDKLIEVWKIVYRIHPEWNLKICGEGGEYENLSNHIKRLNLQNCVILTNKFLSVIPEFLESSIFVLTSQFEAFGNVLVESQICGVPIVSFDVPNGPKEIISAGEDGYIVGLNNIEEMANKIIFLIENPDIRVQMGLAAKRNSIRFNIETILKLYNDILIRGLE